MQTKIRADFKCDAVQMRVQWTVITDVCDITKGMNLIYYYNL